MYWNFRLFNYKINVFVSCGQLSVCYPLFLCVCVCLPVQFFYSKLWNTDCDLSFFSSENRNKSHMNLKHDNFNFDNLRDFSLKAAICREPQDVGPCSDYTVRWWYNRATNRCQQFVYGGCLGNENNFETERACLQRCRR